MKWNPNKLYLNISNLKYNLIDLITKPNSQITK